MLPVKAKHKLLTGFWGEKDTEHTEDVVILGFSFCDRSAEYKCTYVLAAPIVPRAVTFLAVDDTAINGVDKLAIREDSVDRFIFDPEALFKGV